MGPALYVSEVIVVVGAGSTNVRRGGLRRELDHFTQEMLRKRLLEPFGALGLPEFTKYTAR